MNLGIWEVPENDSKCIIFLLKLLVCGVTSM